MEYEYITCLSLTTLKQVSNVCKSLPHTKDGGGFLVVLGFLFDCFFVFVWVFFREERELQVSSVLSADTFIFRNTPPPLPIVSLTMGAEIINFLKQGGI